MQVTVKNRGNAPLAFTGTVAVPLFGRSADNLRDHRHVTSLLNRIHKDPYGVRLQPTMSFNERGHLINHTSYFVVGCDADGAAPVGFFPTQEGFTGLGGDLERPEALTHSRAPQTQVLALDQGKEAMGALQFARRVVAPGASTTFTIFLGIERQATSVDWVKKWGAPAQIEKLLDETKAYWRSEIGNVRFSTGDKIFNQWIQWVQTQPTFRKIFGNSFLPDFDYGRGGRGWRDLWQDCLALLLANPDSVRDDMKRNFGGVRIDGSNATIIARKRVEAAAGDAKGLPTFVPEFIADRNNITRTWMDHGIWPVITSALYINQTGDWSLFC
jgi:cellobiose phosphorylase